MVARETFWGFESPLSQYFLISFPKYLFNRLHQLGLYFERLELSDRARLGQCSQGGPFLLVEGHCVGGAVAAAQALAHRIVRRNRVAMGAMVCQCEVAIVFEEFQQERGLQCGRVYEAWQIFEVGEEQLIEGGGRLARELGGEERFGKAGGGL